MRRVIGDGEHLHFKQVHLNLRCSLQNRQMFLERGWVQDIRPGMPWRLDDKLVRRGSGFAESLRGVGQLFL